MPGIAGGLFLTGDSFPERLLTLLGEALRAVEGQVSEGIVIGPAALTSVGVPPFSAESTMAIDRKRGVTLALDGEAYRVDCLNARMSTEDLLQLYLERGEEFLKAVSGRFSVAVYESVSATLRLASDRHGSRPMYFLQAPDRFLFSSHVQALLVDPEWDRELDRHAIVELLSFGYLQGDRTLFRNVRVLGPGMILVADREGFGCRRYWCLGELFHPERSDDPSAELEEVRLAFNRGVEMRASRGKACLFLTGGLDSRTILSACFSLGVDVQAYTYGLASSDDVEISADIASATGLAWRHLSITNEECYSTANLLSALNWTGGCLNLVHSVGVSVLPHLELEKRGFGLLLGNGSEFIRGGIYDAWHEAPPRAGDLVQLAGILTRRFNQVFPLVEAHSILTEDYSRSCWEIAVAGTLEALRGLEGVAPTEILDAYFLQERARRYLNAGGPLFFGTTAHCRFPFYDRGYLDRCFRLDRSLRSPLSVVQRHIIVQNSEALAIARSTFPVSMSMGPVASAWVRRLARVRERLRRRLKLPPRRQRLYVDRRQAMQHQEATIRKWLESSAAVEAGIFDPVKVRQLLKQQFVLGRDCSVQLGAALTLELFCRKFAGIPAPVRRLAAVTQGR